MSSSDSMNGKVLESVTAMQALQLESEKEIRIKAIATLEKISTDNIAAVRHVCDTFKSGDDEGKRLLACMRVLEATALRTNIMDRVSLPLEKLEMEIPIPGPKKSDSRKNPASSSDLDLVPEPNSGRWENKKVLAGTN